MTRRGVLGLLAGSGLVAVAARVHASLIEPRDRLVVTGFRPRFPGWPAKTRLRSAVLADLHAAPPVVPSRSGNRDACGHGIEGGRHLIVSGGLGCSILPVRVGAPPEIVLIELGGDV